MTSQAVMCRQQVLWTRVCVNVIIPRGAQHCRNFLNEELQRLFLGHADSLQ